MLLSPISNHEGQKKIWQDPNRFILACCGRRFGKTFLAVEKLLKKSCTPNTLNIYMAPTRQQAKDIMWNQLKIRVRQLKWACEINESELKIIRQNKSIIMLRSAEKPDRLRGLGIHFIVLDEFAEYRNASQIWSQIIRPALSDTNGEAFIPFTPKGLNHAYEMFNQAKTTQGWSAYSFKTIDSPFFQTPEGIKELDEARATLNDKDFRQEYEASFETYTGRIYSSFDRTKHHEAYDFHKDNGPIYVGQDFNRSPMASGLFQKVNGVMLQFGEIFHRVGSTQQTCEELRKLYGAYRVIIRPDATGNRKTSNSSLSDFDIIKTHGFEIQTGNINPRVVDRWASVNAAYEKGLTKINLDKCPYTLKDREILCYIEGSCEPDLKDPMRGHMADACDYNICREYPLHTNNKIIVATYT